MTTATGASRKYQPRENWLDPDPPVPTLPRAAVGRGDFFEIKPRTPTGIAKGLVQLNTYVGGHPRPKSRRLPRARASSAGRRSWRPIVSTAKPWLVTYVPRTAAGKPARFGRASTVSVYVQRVEPRDADKAQCCGPLYSLGATSVPTMTDFPRVDQPGFFGHAIEGVVRGQLFRKVDRPAARGGGGAGSGPDAWVEELAALFEELSNWGSDPLFRELATQLTHLTN